jgi:hypothetical protein
MIARDTPLLTLGTSGDKRRPNLHVIGEGVAGESKSCDNDGGVTSMKDRGFMGQGIQSGHAVRRRMTGARPRRVQAPIVYRDRARVIDGFGGRQEVVGSATVMAHYGYWPAVGGGD